MTQRPEAPETVISKLVNGGRGVSFVLPLAPVPASRPRVTKWGTYYGERYTKWTNAARAHFTTLRASWNLDIPVYKTAPVMACLQIVAAKPKTGKKLWPTGDIDNYEKAIFDAATKSGLFWKDDDQLVMHWSVKRYARAGEVPHTRMWMAECDAPPSGEDVYDLGEEARVALTER